MRFNKNIARDKLNIISKKHLLNPQILQNVIWGRVQGWSQTRIAEESHINPNTVSKYLRIIEREMDTKEIKELMIIIGLIWGGSYLIKEIFK